jgi:DNA polymerase-4
MSGGRVSLCDVGRSQAVRGGGEASGAFGPGADDTGCGVLHVDMDAFFASVEVQRRPELRGKPVVVGGVGPRGVVSSASYQARKYGVRSAMPTGRARALCPQAIFLPPDFAAYSAASRTVMGIFSDVTPLVEPLSLDEAFLDVRGATRLLGRPAAIAGLIRSRVAAELGLTCSVGVASTKFVAKLGSTRAKPDGVIVVPADRVLDFLHPLPVEALWGVGERAAETLRRLGLTTVADLAQAPVGMLRGALGAAAAAHLHELSWGRDPRSVSPEHVDKSIGAEVTFDIDVSDAEQLRRTVLGLAGKVARRLRSSDQAGRTVSIKVRLADFRTVNRSRTLPSATDVGREIFSTAWALFETLFPAVPSVRPGRPGAGDSRPSGGHSAIIGAQIRLIGVRVEGLIRAEGAPRQVTLGTPEHGWREAETAADVAAARFGHAMVGPASLLPKAAARPERSPDSPERAPNRPGQTARDRP